MELPAIACNLLTDPLEAVRVEAPLILCCLAGLRATVARPASLAASDREHVVNQHRGEAVTHDLRDDEAESFRGFESGMPPLALGPFRHVKPLTWEESTVLEEAVKSGALSPTDLRWVSPHPPFLPIPNDMVLCWHAR